MLKLYNTLTRSKIDFTPIDKENVKLYVCGPTVYNFPHIGNARSVLAYDMLFRVLSYLYKSVKYVRNITDVDDKIILAAEKEGKSVSEISSYYTDIFQKNMKSLSCLSPTFEPKATEHIPAMITLIEKLVDKQCAYFVKGSVYFDISSFSSYGRLSGRKLKELISGSRVEIDLNKRNPSDFILWKSTTKHGWNSPWGYGRPGWHIECSAMSTLYLGTNFDIHGGGADLQFPHHENEIAQSCCAYPGSHFANYWIHNGFVLAGSDKMSKSLGNVITVHDLLKKGLEPSIIRYTLLSTHYRKPLNWTDDVVQESANIMNKFMSIAQNHQGENIIPDFEIIGALCDDLNIPQAIASLHQYAKEAKEGNKKALSRLIGGLKFLGLLTKSEDSIDDKIRDLIDKRKQVKERKDFVTADKIREELLTLNVKLLDGKDGKTTWEKMLKKPIS